MVKIFTKEEAVVCKSEGVDREVSEEQFEADLKANLQKLVREPRKRVIDEILNYSLSLRELR